MGMLDLSTATEPNRRRRDGAQTKKAAHFWRRFPPAAKRHTFIRNALFERRHGAVNPNRTEITDVAQTTELIKKLVLDMGASIVGIAAYDPRLTFDDADKLDHEYIVVFGMTMGYDIMADIGPRSQDEVHRVYYSLDDIGTRLADQIGGFGYSATMQPNGGELPLVAYAQLAGLGEIGKHGSLISPELGSSFRLCALSTDMPLAIDGPTDHGIDEVCASCKVCARFCPGEAIKHDKKKVNGVERWYIDTPACESYFYKMYGCKICLMVCPYNGRGNLKEQFKLVAKDIREAKNAEGLLALIEKRTDMRYEDIDYDSEEGLEDADNIR